MQALDSERVPQAARAGTIDVPTYLLNGCGSWESAGSGDLPYWVAHWWGHMGPGLVKRMLILNDREGAPQGLECAAE
jgi:hypothetical protein